MEIGNKFSSMTECHDPLLELSPIYIHASRPSLVSYWVHSSSSSPPSTHPRVRPDHLRLRFNMVSPEAINTIKTATHSAASAHPRPRGRSRHRSSRGRSHDRRATTRHTGHLVGRPPPRHAWALGVSTLISLTLLTFFLLLMPLPVKNGFSDE